MTSAYSKKARYGHGTSNKGNRCFEHSFSNNTHSWSGKAYHQGAVSSGMKTALVLRVPGMEPCQLENGREAGQGHADVRFHADHCQVQAKMSATAPARSGDPNTYLVSLGSKYMSELKELIRATDYRWESLIATIVPVLNGAARPGIREALRDRLHTAQARVLPQ